jgi:hypothetical protein
MIGISSEKERALRNLDTMTDEEGNALFLQWWPQRLLGEPLNDKPFVALAGAHKARIRWPDATKKQVKASRAWLRAHGYLTNPATMRAEQRIRSARH